MKETEGFIDGYIKPSKITTTAVSLLDPTSGLILHGLNFYETMNYTLNDLEKQYHIQALQYALNYSKNGEITKWFNNNRDSAGKVKILYSFNFEKKYCRTYESFILLNGAKNINMNTLCKKISTDSWEQM